MAMGQVSRSAKTSKGPRALGLLEMAPGKKPRLVPICILIDGKFYDAGAYKASPVPMALLSGTVYEGVKTGVSQGLFTVTAALEREDTNIWMGEGTWQDAAALAALAAKSGKKASSKEPRGLDQDDGPPVLRRASAEKAAQAETTPAAASPIQSTPPAASPSVSSEPTKGGANAGTAESSAPATDSSPEDPDRPVLHRGGPAPRAQHAVTTTVPAATTKPAGQPAAKNLQSPAVNSAQEIPAISDAMGPDARSYKFVMTPQEEQDFQKKMLGLAADEVRARVQQLAKEKIGGTPPAGTKKRSLPRPASTFEDVQLRVFDLSSSNEPVLVLTARAQTPESPGVQYLVALVTRQDINGDFHKILSNVTDAQHLDILPKMELIDAVDADGDGRGELLFRKTSDSGSAYSIYRVIGDQLYPLFEGTIG